MEWDSITGCWRVITQDQVTDGASSSSHDEDDVARRNRILLLTGAACGSYHIENFLVKEPCRTSALTGSLWIQELEEGNAIRIYESFRMHRGVFFNLCTSLESYGLRTSRNVGVPEQVAIFLFIAGQSSSNRNAQERFQHSGETINHYFHAVLNACIAMAMDWVRPRPRNGVHPYIRGSNKYYLFFKVILHFQYIFLKISVQFQYVVLPYLSIPIHIAFYEICNRTASAQLMVRTLRQT